MTIKNTLKNKPIIRRIADKIKKEYNPEKIVIFGSYAWGKPTKDSDIDLFIIKETNEKPRDRRIKIREILDEENASVALGPMVYTPSEIKKRLMMGDDFIKKILNKGVVVYG